VQVVHHATEFTGELRGPRVEGTLGVTSGNVNLDEIVALLGPGPYATSPTDLTTSAAPTTSGTPAVPAAPDAPTAQAAASEKGGEEDDSGGVFDNLTMDVRLTIPDDLVLKANSLQTPGSPIGLGSRDSFMPSSFLTPTGPRRTR
jgi:hypothetical protein